VTRTNLFGTSHEKAARVIEVFEWIVAIDSFDFGDAGPLKELFEDGEEIPPELMPIIRAIRDGKRVPNKKASVKQKIAPRKRLMAAGLASAFLGLFDDMLSTRFEPEFDGEDARFIAIVADKDGREPFEIVSQINSAKERIKEALARDLGISKHSLRDYLIHLRRIIEHYPNI